MRIAVDIDGVLFPWDRVARQFMLDRFGHSLRPSTNWHAIRHAVPREHWSALWTADGQDAVFSQVDRHYRDDVAMVNDLLALGHQVHFVTHRDPKRTLRHTAAFLDLHFGRAPAWAGVHSIKSSTPKRTLARWDVLIDDKPETVLDVAAREATMVFAPLRTWNLDELLGADSPNLRVYSDPAEVVAWVEDRDWRAS